MKKKLLSLIAVSAALATAGSVLVACGGDGNNSVKTEVTKEQWAAAFAVDNFTSNIKATEKTELIDDDKTIAQEMTLIVGAQKYGDFSCTLSLFTNDVKSRERDRIRIVAADGDDWYERRSELVGDKWEEGKWYVYTKSHLEYDDEEWQEDVLSSFGFAYIVAFADNYDSFNYTNGAYVLSKNELVLEDRTDDYEDYTHSFKVTASKTTIKFADGKLVSVDMTMKTVSTYTYTDEEPEVSEDEGTVSIKITYSTQKVTPPEGAVKYEEEEDEE